MPFPNRLATKAVNVFLLSITALIPTRMAGLQEAALNEDLRSELLRMAKVDQQVVKQSTWNPTAENLELERSTVAEHSERLGEILDEWRWPGYSLVGRDGASAAWLLAQHTRDLQLQKRCLLLMTNAVAEGEASRTNWAYLVDRVRVNQGRRQLYGTQFVDARTEEGLRPRPIEDEASLDKRRAEVGLPPFSEYVEAMRDYYQKGKER